MYKDYIKHKNWRKHIRDLDPSNRNNNGPQNEDFIVWMATEAFSRFPKLYRRPNRTAEGCNSGLKAVNYTLHVEYSKQNSFKFRLDFQDS